MPGSSILCKQYLYIIHSLRWKVKCYNSLCTSFQPYYLYIWHNYDRVDENFRNMHFKKNIPTPMITWIYIKL